MLFIICSEDLYKKLKSIRENGYEEADTKGRPLLSILGYDGGLELEEAEALLISFVEQFLKINKTKHDRALMALGFLDGYEGKGIGNRRAKYLIESGCLEQEYPQYYEQYLQCKDDNSRQEILKCVGKDKLRPREDTILKNLARSISGQIKDMPAYIDDLKERLQKDGKNRKVKYPIPNYLDSDKEDTAPLPDSIILAPNVSLWGPGNRSTFTIEEPADYVTFNSITNNPRYGDERNFAHIKESDANDSAYTNEISLRAGKEYTIFVCYHNNASSTYGDSGIAHGAYIKAEIPSTIKRGATSTGSNIYVGASNANPREVFGNIYFANSTGGDMTLRYIQGSATLTNHKGTFELADSIISTGAVIGFDSMNGDLPGCNEYSGYVTFKIKAVQPDFALTTQMRKAGTKNWVKALPVDPGDELEYLLTYKNTGSVIQEDVIVSGQLPDNIIYVPDSTLLSNTKSRNQKVADGVTTTGINIGAYSPNSTAYVWFKAKVAIVSTGRVDTPNGASTDKTYII